MKPRLTKAEWFVAAVCAAAALIIVTVKHLPSTEPIPTVLQSVESTLKKEEGFRSHPYPDTRGNLTIGYGTNISEGITLDEAEFLLTERLRRTGKDLAIEWPPYKSQPERVRAALLDMAYQIGVEGLMEFKEMLTALERGDYTTARAQALDSSWARETPKRARRVLALFVG